MRADGEGIGIVEEEKEYHKEVSLLCFTALYSRGAGRVWAPTLDSCKLYKADLISADYFRRLLSYTKY